MFSVQAQPGQKARHHRVPKSSLSCHPDSWGALRLPVSDHAYLDLDLFPVFVCELVATPVLQLLKNTSVYGQAVVDFPEEVLYVCAVGAQ